MSLQSKIEGGETGRRENRRRFIARGIELASTIPLIGFLMKNFMTKRDYYAIDCGSASTAERLSSSNSFYSMHEGFRATLDNLCKTYASEYNVAHTELGITFDTKGNPHISPKTVYKWEEPENVPKHQIVDSWKENQKKFCGKVKNLASKKVIDLRKIKELKVDKRQMKGALKGALSTAMYGGEIALLLGYEEIGASLNKDYDETVSERIRKTNTQNQITRRSFFKVGAALAGALAGYNLMNYNLREAEKGEAEMRKEIERISRLSDVTSDEAFKKYFEISYQEHIQRAKNCVEASTNALASGVANKKVKDSFEQVVGVGAEYSGELEKMFREGIPLDLGARINGAYLLEEAEKSTSIQESGSMEGILLEGLLVGGAMAAILIPGEIINRKLS